MKIKTADLIGPALRWAVAKCVGIELFPWPNGTLNIYRPVTDDYAVWEPDTRWDQGMPILDRAGICVRAIRKPGHALDGTYMAMEARRLGTSKNPGWHEVCWPENKPGSNEPPRIRWDGPTHLVAGLRCYVGITLGDEIEVQDELIQGEVK